MHEAFELTSSEGIRFGHIKIGKRKYRYFLKVKGREQNQEIDVKGGESMVGFHWSVWYTRGWLGNEVGIAGVGQIGGRFEQQPKECFNFGDRSLR